jgi:hypothetical protein
MRQGEAKAQEWRIFRLKNKLWNSENMPPLFLFLYLKVRTKAVEENVTVQSKTHGNYGVHYHETPVQRKFCFT